MKTCKICGKEFDESFEGTTVNAGLDSEYYVCDECIPSECDNGRIISCENCGAYFSADLLKTEDIYGQSFTPCPSCKKDMIDCLTREEFVAEYAPYRYAVTVRFTNGVRGYIVSVNVGEPGASAVIKKLADKVDLSGAAEITVGEILLLEDEF